MVDRPQAPELLQAVAAFLREQVLPATQGALAFQVRVAANAIDIARRESLLAPGALAQEADRLRALLGEAMPADLLAANRLLCERIATGVMDLSTPGLLAHLRQTTLDKIAIDQPGYDQES
jgi:hypothetical protein